MPRNNSGRRIIPTGVGGTIALAQASLLVVRYPSAIDTPPTIVDNTTPLSGIFHNYLALMLEAVMAELGPMGTVYSNPNVVTLKDFLGVEFANRVSNWRSFTKTHGGDEAGQVFGLIKNLVSKLASGYGNDATTVAYNQWQGAHPTTKKPGVWFVVSGINQNPPDMVSSIGGGVRGRANLVGTTSWSVTYKGHPATAWTPPSGPGPGAPTSGGGALVTHWLMMFMVEAF